MSKPQLPTDEQIYALQGFAARHGRSWKRTLSEYWADGRDEREPHASTLRQIRNALGPSWLMKFKLPEAKRPTDPLPACGVCGKEAHGATNEATGCPGDDAGCSGCLTASPELPCLGHGCTKWCRRHYEPSFAISDDFPITNEQIKAVILDANKADDRELVQLGMKALGRRPEDADPEARKAFALAMQLPRCARTMGCLCAGHARGNPPSSKCDTSETPSLEELRDAKRAAETAKYNAFEALRAREKLIASRFKDPYGRDTHAYDRAKQADEECVSLLAAFNAARDAFHAAGRSYREAVKGASS